MVKNSLVGRAGTCDLYQCQAFSSTPSLFPDMVTVTSWVPPPAHPGKAADIVKDGIRNIEDKHEKSLAWLKQRNIQKGVQTIRLLMGLEYAFG